MNAEDIGHVYGSSPKQLVTIALPLFDRIFAADGSAFFYNMCVLGCYCSENLNRFLSEEQDFLFGKL